MASAAVTLTDRERRLVTAALMGIVTIRDIRPAEPLRFHIGAEDVDDEIERLRHRGVLVWDIVGGRPFADGYRCRFSRGEPRA